MFGAFRFLTFCFFSVIFLYGTVQLYGHLTSVRMGYRAITCTVYQATHRVSEDGTEMAISAIAICEGRKFALAMDQFTLDERKHLDAGDPLLCKIQYRAVDSLLGFSKEVGLHPYISEMMLYEKPCAIRLYRPILLW